MAKTAKITLAGVEYTIRPFTLGQMEILTEMQADPKLSLKLPFEALRLVLKRAEPKCENPNDLEIEPDEMQVAFEKIMELSGMAIKKGGGAAGGAVGEAKS